MVVDEEHRKRKLHTKSRKGCANCKLRRVKCDETRPECLKCTTFGVSCDYDSNNTKSDDATDLQVNGVTSFQISTPNTPPAPAPAFDAEKLIITMMDAPLHLYVEPGSSEPSIVYIDKPHLALLRKFINRSVYTIGTADSVDVYRRALTESALQHSYVLHAVLRFVLMHDRFLYDPVATRPSTAESFHAYHAAALFSTELSKSSHTDEEKDALWGTAALLGGAAFAGIEATSAETAWPLSAPDFSDLDWLKMSEGKKQVWKMTDPLREGGAFKAAIEVEQHREQATFHRALDPSLDALFPYVTKLYNLDSPAADGDPYRTAASIIERLVPIEATHSTIMWFLSFIGHMEVEFRQLLEEKDPGALLLLSWWYAKLIPYNAWWITRRGIFECQAICLYLEKTLPEEHEVRGLLEFPKSVCFNSEAVEKCRWASDVGVQDFEKEKV